MRVTGWLAAFVLLAGCAGAKAPPSVDRADVALAGADFTELHTEHLALQEALTELAGARERRTAAELEHTAARAELEGLRAAESAAEKAAEARERRREHADGSVDVARRARAAGEAKVAWKEEALARAEAEVALEEARERLARAELEQARLTLLRETGSPAAADYRPEAFAKEVDRARSAHADARERFLAAVSTERAARVRYERLAEAVPGAS